MGKKLYGDELKLLPATKTEAESINSPYFFTGKQCQNGHIAQRITKNRGQCFDCVAAHARRFREQNTETMKRFNAARREPEYQEKQRTIKRKRYAESPEYRELIRDRGLRRLYKITAEEYDKRFLAQKGKCQICKKTTKELGQKRKLAVDHDHKSGAIRGLLCSQCNQAIGKLNDSPELCEIAATYLEKAGDYRDPKYLNRRLREHRKRSS